MLKIPLFKPSLGKEELKAIGEVLKSGWLGLGPKTEEFEKRFAEYTGVKYAIAVNSCTEALHLAIRALGIKEGEVITTPITFVSAVHAIKYSNLKPVFADVQESNLNINPESIIKNVNSKTKIIIVTHYGGHPCDMDEIMKIADKYKIFVIEDCAHACGSEYKGKKVGSIGHMGCFSFHAVKNLATGDGGMITLNNPSLYERIKKMRWCGINKSTYQRADGKYAWNYDVEIMGYKSHMNDINATIGLVQLDKLEKSNNRRREIAEIYRKAFKNADWIKPLSIKEGVKTSQHNFVIKIEGDREELIKHLASRGISAGVHYKPIYLHSYYKKIGVAHDTPIADQVWKNIVTLPLYPDLTEEDIQKVIEGVLSFKS
jgi:perosamine synthetase